MTDLIAWLREQIAGKPGRPILATRAAHEALLDDLLAQRHYVCEDAWYTCAVATEERDGGTTARDDAGDCDCGRDMEVERRVRLLALAYRHHPGYRDEWRP
jgi:Family of unknown function (DUF6221)